jgi:hypothetical protein
MSSSSVAPAEGRNQNDGSRITQRDVIIIIIIINRVGVVGWSAGGLVGGAMGAPANWGRPVTAQSVRFCFGDHAGYNQGTTCSLVRRVHPHPQGA